MDEEDDDGPLKAEDCVVKLGEWGWQVFSQFETILIVGDCEPSC